MPILQILWWPMPILQILWWAAPTLLGSWALQEKEIVR